MPEAADPLTSIGYLVAAGLVTLGSLVAYAVVLNRRLARARARFTGPARPLD